MRDRARSDQDHAGRAVIRAHIFAQIAFGKPGDGFFGAEDRPAHRLTRIACGLQMFEYEIVRRVARLPEFLNDDFAFAFQLVGDEARMNENVGQKIEGERNIVSQNARVIGGLFARSIGVEIAADGFHLDRDILRRTARGTLERHMFKHMGEAHFLRRLIARAAIDPDANRRAL